MLDVNVYFIMFRVEDKGIERRLNSIAGID